MVGGLIVLRLLQIFVDILQVTRLIYDHGATVAIGRNLGSYTGYLPRLTLTFDRQLVCLLLLVSLDALPTAMGLVLLFDALIVFLVRQLLYLKLIGQVVNLADLIT